MTRLFLLLALIAVAGCTNGNAQYQTPARGGWDNFRADAPGHHFWNLAALQ